MNGFRWITVVAIAATALVVADFPCQAQNRSRARSRKKDTGWLPTINLTSYRIPVISDSLEMAGNATKKAVKKTQKTLGLDKKLPGSDLIVTPIRQVGKTAKNAVVKTAKFLSPKKLGLPKPKLPKVPDSLNPLKWPSQAAKSLSWLSPASWSKSKKRSGRQTTRDFLRQPSLVP